MDTALPAGHLIEACHVRRGIDPGRRGRRVERAEDVLVFLGWTAGEVGGGGGAG